MVSIHLWDVFALNQQAFEALGESEAVELFKQCGGWIIGFGASVADSPDAYKIRHHTKHSHQVAGKAFSWRSTKSQRTCGAAGTRRSLSATTCSR
jgi:hypothetical protein